MAQTISSVLVILLCSSSAFSQPQQEGGPRFFVGGGAIVDNDYTWASPAIGSVGFTASAGVDVSRHLGVRLGVDVPQTITTRSESSTATLHVTSIQRRRSLSWSGLIDMHGRLSDRVRLGFVTGITAARRPDEFDTSIDELGPGGVVLRHRESSTPYTFTWWGATAGVELPLALSDRMSIVPEARAIWFPLAEYGRTTIFRPGVALRWRF
jgi:hypothetical protein